MIPLFDINTITSILRDEEPKQQRFFFPSDSSFSVGVQVQKPKELIEINILGYQVTDGFMESYDVGDVFTEEEWMERYPEYPYDPDETRRVKMSENTIADIKRSLPSHIVSGEKMYPVIEEWRSLDQQEKTLTNWRNLLNKYRIDFTYHPDETGLLYAIEDTYTTYPPEHISSYDISITIEYFVIMK